MKYGFYFSPYQNNTKYDFYGNGAYFFFGPSTGTGSGTDLADFLMGLPDNYFQAADAVNNIRTYQIAGYAQAAADRIKGGTSYLLDGNNEAGDMGGGGIDPAGGTGG